MEDQLQFEPIQNSILCNAKDNNDFFDNIGDQAAILLLHDFHQESLTFSYEPCTEQELNYDLIINNVLCKPQKL
jgi:hypothetical protein